MSVFTVKLQNPSQGQLDIDPSTGLPFTTSVQRSIYVAGPNRIERKLNDGDVFTDCNYWKRFAYPQLPLDQAFIEVTTDDGSVYSDDSEENTFPLFFGGESAMTISASSAFTDEDNIIDILSTYGSYAKFVQIQNLGTAGNADQDIKVKLNGSASAIMTLAAGDTQVFNAGDLSVSVIAFQGNDNESADDTDVQVLLSVESVCNS